MNNVSTSRNKSIASRTTADEPFRVDFRDHRKKMSEFLGSNPKQTRLKKKAQKEVVHPLLIEAAATIRDEFWIDLLTKAATNVLPPGFCFHEDVLSYEKGGNRINRHIERVDLHSDPTLAALQFMDFIRLKGNIYSDAERELADIGIEEEDTFDGNWKRINKLTKTIMISRYVREHANMYDLTEDQTQEAWREVNRAYLHGALSATDFIVEGRALKDIVDVHWSPNGVVVARSIDHPEPVAGIPFVKGCSPPKPTKCQAACITALANETKFMNRKRKPTLGDIRAGISRSSMNASIVDEWEEEE